MFRQPRGIKVNFLHPVLVGVTAAIASLGMGLAVLNTPLLLGVTVVLGVGVYFLLNFFGATVVGLLVIRSSLDAFSSLQLPAAFAIGMLGLSILYLAIALVLRIKIHTDKLSWFLFTWIALQGLWVILLPLGGLGRGGGYLMNAVEEWVRLLTWVMIYFFIMQLKDRLHPKQVINWLLLSLIAPLTGALLQITFPPSVLPSFLVYSGSVIEAGSRINGTMGHPNTLASFSILFIGLSLWKLGAAEKRLPWLILVASLVFVLASTKSIGGIVMMTVFTLAFVIPRLNALNFIGSVLLIGLVVTFFASSDFGRERLASLYETPLLNPDLDLSRTLLLAWRDGNSLNWRIAQWTYLLESWKDFPILGYGLSTVRSVSVFGNYAHNDYVGTLVETGAVGFAIFLSFLGAQFAHLINIVRRPFPAATKPQRSLCFMLIALLIAVVVAMIAENISTHTTFFFYWFTLLAIAGWDWSEDESMSDY